MTTDTTSNTETTPATSSPAATKAAIAKAKAERIAKRAATPACALPVAPPSPKKEAAKRPCVCGCGAATGGLFAPGHDARLHAWLAHPADKRPKAVNDAIARWETAKAANAKAKAERKAKATPKAK